MSSFNTSSRKKSLMSDDRKIKKHVTAFYKIIDEIEALAVKIKELNLEVTEENVKDIASDIMGRDLDSMEIFLLMGKLESHVEQSDN